MKDATRRTVYFTGSLPAKGETPFGGGEVGNMRTVRMLRSFGYRVTAVRRYRSNARDSKFKNLLTYPFRILGSIAHWFCVLLFGKRKNSVAHISGFYGSTIIVETLQVFVAKLLGYRLIYELRGGGARGFYEEGNGFYRKQFKYILNKADFLFSQGRENEPLLKSLCDRPVYYYPNCVRKGFYPEEMPSKPSDRINLLFYGRIETEKNPLLIVEAAALLQKEFDNVNLTIIGNGQPELLGQVRNEMAQSLGPGTYELLPGCEHEKLQRMLADKHFYVFPSVQPREGQSNAVTEAMSFGIIPIASPQGFNRSTIGDDRLIVENMTPGAYAERMAAIVRAGETGKYSQFVRQRFLANYTEQAVFEKSRSFYNEIFQSW